MGDLPKETSQRGMTGSALARALAAADAVCATANQGTSPGRRRVLEVLLASGAAMKAYDIIGAYYGAGRPVAPTTVYRTLEFLERMGFVHRLESINAFIACRIGERGHAAGFLICERCGEVYEFEADLAAEQTAAAAEEFKVERVTLECRGICRSCRSRLDSDHKASPRKLTLPTSQMSQNRSISYAAANLCLPSSSNLPGRRLAAFS
jgi:Fur family zinc uptake transcriptional regulator